MAYQLRIERSPGRISLGEWLQAASRVPRVRVHSGDIEIANPNTGESIKLKSSPGDLDVQIETDWVAAIHFSNGRAAFRGTSNIESPDDPVHRAAVALARILNAEILGEEGEKYNW